MDLDLGTFSLGDSGYVSPSIGGQGALNGSHGSTDLRCPLGPCNSGPGSITSRSRTASNLEILDGNPPTFNLP